MIKLIVFLTLIKLTSLSPAPWGSIVNIRKLIEEQRDILGMSLGASNYLLSFQGCMIGFGSTFQWEIRRAEFLFSVEGEDIALTCDPCTPPNKLVHWRWITFEGVDSGLSRHESDDDDEIANPITYNITEYQELKLTSPKPDLSSFYCYWEDTSTVTGNTVRVVSKIWTVEIVSVKHMKKTSARSWRKAQYLQRDSFVDLDVGSTRIRVGTVWSGWSECSRCGGDTGKKYKTGYCSVAHVSGSSLDALELYGSPVSCSLVIDFHPDVLSQSSALEKFDVSSSLNTALGKAPRIMVGYCKDKRVVCRGDYRDSVVVANKVVRELFEDYHMVGDGGGKGEGDMSWSVRRVLWMMKSVVGGVPLGWGNLPEMIALVGLVGLQVYVVLLVCRWRKDAN